MKAQNKEGGDTLYKKIKELCSTSNVTIAELEKSCGFGKNTIWKWDSHEPSVSKVKKVADYFGVTVEDLIATDEE